MAHIGHIQAQPNFRAGQAELKLGEAKLRAFYQLT